MGELDWRWSSYRKLKWKENHLIVSFLLLLLLHLQCASSKQGDGVIVNPTDYQALQALKHEFFDSRGFLSSWNHSTAGACSSWDGIKCVNGQVIAIQLPWKGLGGRISEKIGHLKALRRLSLHDNALEGPVPVSLGLLGNLRGVYLFNNQLSGTIPPSIGNCPVLQTLDLSNNKLSGFIPPSVANSTRLYRFNLSFNQISGSIPDQWGSKSGNISFKLKSLLLDHNLLSGRIPSSLSKLSTLEVIDLSHNQIVGSIPDELGNLSRLTSLDLSHNYLDNHIPETLGKLRDLSVLNLSSNRFQGPIPLSIGNITSIALLDLSGNNLTGEIPNSLVNLLNLSSLDLSYNRLIGPVPALLAMKFNSSSFVGNPQLCGYSSSTTNCSSSISSNGVPHPSHQEPDHHSRKLDTKDIILIAAGAILIALLLLCCVLLCCLIVKTAASKSRIGKRGGLMGRNIKPPAAAVGTEVESGGETGGKLVHFDGPFVFTADDLLCATAEIMGKSTYGTAYKATLEDNNQVSVKRLREKYTKGQKEFETEVTQLGKIRHRNILALRAYYLGPKGEKLLVYDHMSNGSLASFLHARGPETSIPWPQRMSIVRGITRGICYLHRDENIVHGNLTSSSILLDEQNNPKIAGVGLSHLMTTAANTDAIAAAGTMGYRAPELLKLKHASTKTDVYSLGVIMLELLTGKSPSEATDGLDLPQWVASIVKEEWTNEVFDVELLADATNIGEELLNTLKLALHCVDPSPTARPEAQQVAQKLQEIKPGCTDDDAVMVPVDGTTESARD